MCSSNTEASVNLGIDSEYALYGEAVPLLEKPLAKLQNGGGCGCSANKSLFGGYLETMEKKINTKNDINETKIMDEGNQSGGGGGVGYSFGVENYIAGNPEVVSYGANMEPILNGKGGIYYPKCGEPLCVGSSGQYGGSKLHKKKSNNKLIKTTNKKMKRTHKNKSTKKNKSHSKHHSKRHSKHHSKRHSSVRHMSKKQKKMMCKKMMSKKMLSKKMYGGAADFRTIGDHQASYPFDGETSRLEIDPSLKNRTFNCRQPNWGPECV